jgi:hypothetical protein
VLARPYVDFSRLTHVLVILRAPEVEALPIPQPGMEPRQEDRVLPSDEVRDEEDPP